MWASKWEWFECGWLRMRVSEWERASKWNASVSEGDCERASEWVSEVEYHWVSGMQVSEWLSDSDNASENPRTYYHRPCPRCLATMTTMINTSTATRPYDHDHEPPLYLQATSLSVCLVSLLVCLCMCTHARVCVCMCMCVYANRNSKNQ